MDADSSGTENENEEAENWTKKKQKLKVFPLAQRSGVSESKKNFKKQL